MSAKSNKWQNIGVIGFCIFIISILGGSSYIFFNNTSNVELTIRSNDEQLRRKDAITEALTKTLINKNDTIKQLDESLKTSVQALSNKDFLIKKQLSEIKKLKEEKDSLKKAIKKINWSDIQPIQDD